MHLRPKTSQHSPYAATKPVFGQPQQFTSLPDPSAPLDSSGIKTVQ